MKSHHVTKIIGTKSYSSLLDDCLKESREDEVPEGAISVYDIVAAEKGITRAQADGILRRKEQAGEVRSIKLRRRHGGKLRFVAYYVRKDAP